MSIIDRIKLDGNNETAQKTLVGIITAGLTSKRSNKRTRSVFYASDGGVCGRKNYFLANQDGESSWSAASEIYTKIGIAIHELVYGSLIKQETLLFRDYRLPDCGLSFGAEVDGIIKFQDKIYGLEIKSCGELPSSVKPDHRAQAYIYSVITGLPFIVLYVSRNVADYTGELKMKTFFLEDDYVQKRDAIKQIVFAHFSMLENKIPTRSYAFRENKFPCNDCKFKTICYNNTQENMSLEDFARIDKLSDDFISELILLTKNRTNGILNHIRLNTQFDYARNFLEGNWNL